MLMNQIVDLDPDVVSLVGDPTLEDGSDLRQSPANGLRLSWMIMPFLGRASRASGTRISFTAVLVVKHVTMEQHTASSLPDRVTASHGPMAIPWPSGLSVPQAPARQQRGWLRHLLAAQ